jgi:hypothetical protein
MLRLPGRSHQTAGRCNLVGKDFEMVGVADLLAGVDEASDAAQLNLQNHNCRPFVLEIVLFPNGHRSDRCHSWARR